MKGFYLILLAAITFQSCDDSMNQAQVVHNDQFNWTMTIPDGFEEESKEDWEELQKKGADAIEETFDQEIESLAQNVFIFKKDETNYFESNYQPFDTELDGDYLVSCREVNDVIYKTFLAQMVDLPIDSNSTTVMVDGLEFQQFNVFIEFPNDMILTTHMYSRLFEGTELAVNIMYVNEEAGKSMIDAWMGSTFH